MNSNTIVQFELGQIVITPSALEVLPRHEVMQALNRHANCDWCDVSAEDGKENDLSLKEGFRLLSVYHTTSSVLDHDRSGSLGDYDSSARRLLIRRPLGIPGGHLNCYVSRRLAV